MHFPAAVTAVTRTAPLAVITFPTRAALIFPARTAFLQIFTAGLTFRTGRTSAGASGHSAATEVLAAGRTPKRSAIAAVWRTTFATIRTGVASEPFTAIAWIGRR